MPINSYEFGGAWPAADPLPPYYSVSWGNGHGSYYITGVNQGTDEHGITYTYLATDSGSGPAWDSGSAETGNSKTAYPLLESIGADVFMSTTTTVESSGVTWDLYTTSYSTGSTTASTSAASSTTSSVETETIITTTSPYSLTLDSSQTAGSDQVIYGTFLTASSDYTGPITEMSTTSSISLSYGSTASLWSTIGYLSLSNPGFSFSNSTYTEIDIFDADYVYSSTSRTLITLFVPVLLKGRKAGSPLLSWVGTTWGSGDDIYVAESSYGTDLQPAGILTASAHPRIREAISYSEYTSGYFISGDSVIYQTTTVVSGSTVGTTVSSQLSVAGSASSSVSTSGIVGFSELDLTIFDYLATLAGGQEWSVSYSEGPTSGAFLAITNGSDGSSSTTFTVGGTDFSSVISCASDANVVLETLLMAQPPITTFADSDGSTSSGYPDGTYWIG